MTRKEPLLEVTSFGEFSISLRAGASDDSSVPSISESRGHSNNDWTLLEYLILFGRKGVPSEELTELLWPEEGDAADPIGSLRLLVHRARAELDKLGRPKGSELIFCRAGAYMFNCTISVQTDAAQFETYYRASRKGASTK